MLQDRVAQVMDTLKRESEPWGRCPKLIAVTKYSTPQEILPLKDLNVTDIGENRVQALRDKLPFLEGKFSIHLIGQLQSNKVKYIIKDVCLIHSLDHASLAQEIDRQAQKAGIRMPVLIQVNIAREPQKAGIDEAELLPFIHRLSDMNGLKVEGLMAIMPIADDPEDVRPLFRQMRGWFDRLRDMDLPGIGMNTLSMGMSDDCVVAAEEGATMVRLGRALFGARPAKI
jgi:pyridoxal phosphate enzyme (YggS family)